MNTNQFASSESLPEFLYQLRWLFFFRWLPPVRNVLLELRYALRSFSQTFLASRIDSPSTMWEERERVATLLARVLAWIAKHPKLPRDEHMHLIQLARKLDTEGLYCIAKIAYVLYLESCSAGMTEDLFSRLRIEMHPSHVPGSEYQLVRKVPITDEERRASGYQLVSAIVKRVPGKKKHLTWYWRMKSLRTRLRARV